MFNKLREKWFRFNLDLVVKCFNQKIANEHEIADKLEYLCSDHMKDEMNFLTTYDPEWGAQAQAKAQGIADELVALAIKTQDGFHKYMSYMRKQAGTNQQKQMWLDDWAVKWNEAHGRVVKVLEDNTRP